MRVRRTDEFEEDLIRHFSTIAQHQPAAAIRFVAAMEELLVALGEFPLHGRAWGSVRSGLVDVRLRKVPGYDILVFYRLATDCVVVLRALHGSRGDLSDVLAEV